MMNANGFQRKFWTKVRQCPVFTGFINDLPAAVPTSTPLYADDALLYSIFSTARSDAGHRLFQDGILSASLWASSWQGRFSPPPPPPPQKKTVVMQIGTTCAATTAFELNFVMVLLRKGVLTSGCTYVHTSQFRFSVYLQLYLSIQFSVVFALDRCS